MSAFHAATVAPADNDPIEFSYPAASPYWTMNISANNAAAVLRRTHRIDALPPAFSGATCNLVPLRPLPHTATIATAEIGPYRFTLAHLPPALFDLVAHKNMICILVPMTDDYTPIVNGRTLQPAHLVAFKEGAPVLVRDDQPTLIGCIAFDAARFPWTQHSKGLDIRLLDAHAMASLRRVLIGAIENGNAADGGSLLTQRIATPQRMTEWLDAMLGETAERYYSWNISGPDLVATMLRIDAFIAAKRNEPIYLQAIADASGVSMRKLHNVVVSLRGMSFTRYLKLCRLWNAYQELLAAPPGELIKTVALRNGFWHLGDFAREYTRQFGEAPSDTRAKADGATSGGGADTLSLQAWLANYAVP